MPQMTIRKWFEDANVKPDILMLHPARHAEWLYGHDAQQKWDRLQGMWWWEDVPASVLDEEFSDSFGGDGPLITAWTSDAVFFVHDYDGKTELRYIDRNPPLAAQRKPSPHGSARP
jgi:hypothetical protein